MNNLKQRIIDYRNNHKESRVLLGVILGEFERKEKEKRWCARLSREIKPDCYSLSKFIFNGDVSNTASYC